MIKISPAIITSVILSWMRKQTGTGQLSAARILGITQASYSRIENGKIIPNINQVFVLCEYYDYDIVVYAKIHGLLVARVRNKLDNSFSQESLNDQEVMNLIKSELGLIVKESIV